MKITLAIALFTLALSAGAETISDRTLAFSINAPKDVRVLREPKSGGGRIFSFTDEKHPGVVVLTATRMRTREPMPLFLAKFVAGASAATKREPVQPVRTLAYRGKSLYVFTHLDVETPTAAGLSVTTVAYFEDQDDWRKLVVLSFKAADKAAPSDADILKRLNELQFQPATAQ